MKRERNIFKVGDRVKLSDNVSDISGFDKSFAGKSGLVIETDKSSIPYHVHFGENGGDWGNQGLTLIESESSTLQGKLNAIEKLIAEVRAMIG